jgi:sterol desaturase/sphingolipid hydroxylase (fatty acid hydroxylase superfamily)
MAASTGFFLLIYFGFAVPVWLLARRIDRPIESRPLAHNQVRLEILNSLRSTLLFGIGMGLTWFAYRLGWIGLDLGASGLKILLEMLFMVIWNDLYTYSVHRFLHVKLKKTHVTHHKSVTATPFTAYSMSSLEALLLGAVMPAAMLLHDFSPTALLFLPLWSILINTLSHSNCDFFPGAADGSLLGFIRHHQMHHSRYHDNFGFFFSQLDTWLGTSRLKHPEQT